MKKGIFIVLLAILCSIVLLAAQNRETTRRSPTAVAAAPPAEESAPPEKESADSALFFSVKTETGLQEVCMAEYLPGVVAAEMPASFAPEALKAQAVAARSYILWCIGHEKSAHPGAAVCTDSGCCKAWLSQTALQERWGEDFEENYARMCRAVQETDGEYLAWEGEPIQAVFHSSSAGTTEDAAAVWNELPYLKSVSTPESAETVPHYISSLELTKEELSATILAVHPEADFSGDAADWLGEVTSTATGRVESLALGGVTLTASELRSLFSLRSTAFTLTWSEGRFLFTVTGYGHGVGMSQYGANLLAQQGADYRTILLHYYSGTELLQSVQETPPSESSNNA